MRAEVYQLYGALFFVAVGKVEALAGQLPAATRVLALIRAGEIVAG